MDYGKREDGTPKGRGFFGELARPDGDVSTELSIGVEIDGKETAIPLLVPALARQEIDHLLAGKPPTPEMVDKAVSFAMERMKQGKSPFAGEGEQMALPEMPSAEQQFQSGFDGVKKLRDSVNPAFVSTPRRQMRHVGGGVRG